MTAHDFGYLAIGMAIPLAMRALVSFFIYKEVKDHLPDAKEMVVHQPEFATHYMEREARRVERPLYERSTPGFVVREVNIDNAHLRGARAE